MFQMLLRLVLLASIVTLSYASFCGDSTIPYSLEILKDGQPILGCARPTCFGWKSNGQPASSAYSFYKINGKEDGFVRQGADRVAAFDPKDSRYLHQQTADCETSHKSDTCDTESQWVGGIAPLHNVTAYPTLLRCCSFDSLRVSTDRGGATLVAGQIVIGGEVEIDGVENAFDYISSLSKVINDDGTVSYDVSIRRMPCKSYPLLAAKSTQFKKAQFGAPTQELIGQTVQLADNSISAPYEGGAQYAAGPQQAPLDVQPPFVDQQQQQQLLVPPSTGYVNPPPMISYVAPPAGGYAVAPPPAPAPAPGCCPSTPYYCFTADTLVKTVDGKKKRMDELKVNDWIQTIDQDKVVYTPVTFWLHKSPSVEAEFIKMKLEDGTELKITAQHYIYKGQCTNKNNVTPSDIPKEAVFAEEVEEGDCLFTIMAQSIKETKVVGLSRVMETGIYAPMTATAKLVVNGVLASCHSNFQSKTLTDSYFSNVEWFYDYMTSIFGRNINQQSTRDLPLGLETLLSVVDFVVPKNMLTSF